MREQQFAGLLNLSLVTKDFPISLLFQRSELPKTAAARGEERLSKLLAPVQNLC